MSFLHVTLAWIGHVISDAYKFLNNTQVEYTHNVKGVPNKRGIVPDWFPTPQYIYLLFCWTSQFLLNR